MKTVLAPNAPWPYVEPAKPKRPKPKLNPPSRKVGRSAKVDQRFDEWLQKENGKLHA